MNAGEVNRAMLPVIRRPSSSRSALSVTAILDHETLRALLLGGELRETQLREVEAAGEQASGGGESEAPA